MAITAKQMAHRDIPVVFHHINFTPLLPVFQKCDKMETGMKKEEEKESREGGKKGRGDSEKKQNDELGDALRWQC